MFSGISSLVLAVLEAAVRHNWTREPENVEEALFVDHNTRLLARDILPEIAAKAS
jgi:hypothetical protein